MASFLGFPEAAPSCHCGEVQGPAVSILLPVGRCERCGADRPLPFAGAHFLPWSPFLTVAIVITSRLQGLYFLINGGSILNLEGTVSHLFPAQDTCRSSSGLAPLTRLSGPHCHCTVVFSMSGPRGHPRILFSSRHLPIFNNYIYW